MKAIFLDFDGVITIPPKWYLKADKIKYIKRIVDETEAKIIVSSSWRMDTVEETRKNMIYKEKRCPRNKMLYWLIDNIYDVTPWVGLGNGRGGEIQQWLNDHPEFDSYVILDDDHDMWDSQMYHFVQTNYEDGITEVETVRAIKVLNKNFFQNSMALNYELRFEYLKKCHHLPNKYDELSKYNDLCKDSNNRYEL
jgi:hypothetical protein